MSRLDRCQRGAGARDHRPLPEEEVGADPARAPVSQEQNGYVTEEAMRHVAELVDVTPAEVYGTASFYEMFRFEPTGKYLINICGTMSCALMGAHELMHHAEHVLGVKAGSTTADGLITLQHAECQAACTEAPTLQVNYRHRYRVTHEPTSTSSSTTCAPAGSTARSRRTARSVATASTSRPTRRSVPSHPDDVTTAPGLDRGRRRHDRTPSPYPVGARVLSAATGRRSSRRASSTTTPTRSSAITPPVATRACARRSTRRRPRSAKRSRSRRCSAAAAPASRPAPSGASRRRACGRATSSSTATSPSPAPTRTAS